MKYKGSRRHLLPVILVLALTLFFTGCFPLSTQAKTYRNFNSIVPKANKQVRVQVKKHKGKFVTTNNMHKRTAGYAHTTMWFSHGRLHAKFTIYIRPSYLHTICAYHEVGHCVDFLCSSYTIKHRRLYVKQKSDSSTFRKIYKSERRKYRPLDQETSESYVTSSSSEYFAQAFAEYTCHPKKFKKMCPKTYAYIKKCVVRVMKGNVVAR